MFCAEITPTGCPPIPTELQLIADMAAANRTGEERIAARSE
jgi:hypothetical protein